MTSYETAWNELKKVTEMVTSEGKSYNKKEIANVFMWLYVRLGNETLAKKLLLDTVFERETGLKKQDRPMNLILRF